MCGIVGKVITTSLQVAEKDVLLMNKAITHRGPDDTGVYLSQNNKVGLGNNRLAIIDLTSAGHMPMSYLDKYEITYNGEVYNFNNEKQKLIELGYKFRTKTDTEVIVALYDRYGTNCLEHLRGMFAFAIYDKTKNIIFLARDRMGKKPLKYFHKNGVFIFASELKAILTQAEVSREIDYNAIYDYLTFSYVPAPRTGFQNIFKLEPGHYLIFEIDRNKLTKKQYWKPDMGIKLNLSEEEWKKRILSELEESTKLRMIADVDIGVMLSGGVDSSSIVAMMAKNSTRPVKTFTIAFKENTHDESQYAMQISKLFRTDHQQLVADSKSAELLPDLAYKYEEPFANSSSTVSFLVSQLARKHVKVILNGDGGDENFAGYDRYRRMSRDRLVDMYKPLIRLAANLLPAITPAKYGRFLQKTKLPIHERFASYIEFFSENEKKRLLKSGVYESSYKLISNAFHESGSTDPRDQTLYWDLTRYLPDELLVKVDIASMSVGLEARSPMVDHKFVEMASKIPFNLKYKNGIHKYILKKSLEGTIPDNILYRKKMGFSIPLGKWFNEDLAKFAKSKVLTKNSFVMKICDNNMVKDLFKTHSEANDLGTKLWSLTALELWYKAYFD